MTELINNMPVCLAHDHTRDEDWQYAFKFMDEEAVEIFAENCNTEMFEAVGLSKYFFLSSLETMPEYARAIVLTYLPPKLFEKLVGDKTYKKIAETINKIKAGRDDLITRNSYEPLDPVLFDEVETMAMLAILYDAGKK